MEDFRRHMEWLAGRRLSVIPLRSILEPGPDDAVALTFDDAFLNFGNAALPLLRDYALPATLFVVSRQVGGTNAWPGESSARGVPVLPLLDWAGIARASECGVEIGAHSQTHPVLSRLSPAGLQLEVAGSQEDIERELGVKPLAFCYPYGETNAAVEARVAETFPIAVTTELRDVHRTRDRTHAIPRIDMHYFRAKGALEAWGTRAFARRLRLRANGRQLRNGLVRMMTRWRL